jgi:hypothetical protein
LRGERGEIEALGARLALVGNGSPEQAAEFRAAHVPELDLYTDPSRATYRALGVVRGVTTTLGPTALRAGLRAFRDGFRQSAVRGDPWVQGATLVVLPGDRVVYRYLSRNSGDHAPIGEVLAALRGATERAVG